MAISTSAGPVRFAAEVADSETEREQGLMFRESLAARSAMLFIFPADTESPFWMKNTLIPLDLIFIDRNFTIITILPAAQPHSEIPLFSHSPYRYVLEINGGLASRFGIQIGNKVKW